MSEKQSTKRVYRTAQTMYPLVEQWLALGDKKELKGFCQRADIAPHVFRYWISRYESASIDKQAHRRKACGSIGELQQLNDALDSALVFAQSHPDTLILVTADHGQAAQIIPEESLFAASPYPIYSPGHMARIITPEGPIMAINYATNDFVAGEHTGVTVPLLSNKEGVGIVPSMMTQPEIFGLIKGYLLPED